MSGFERRFGRPPEVTAEAPGRVNLIGEHTDYNGGFVLPTPIPQRTQVVLAAREDREVRAASANLAGEAIASYALGGERRREDWIDYVQGVTHVLAGEHAARLRGFDAWIDSEVPLGSGLSSSAALEVALLRALRARFELPLADLAIARLAQRVENEFVGAHVGIMDPMVSSLGRDGHALFIDTRDLSFRQVAIPASMEWVVVDSGIRHRNVGGEYNRRREQCEEAARRLGVDQLRDLTRADLDRIARLPEPLARRARHVVTEDERVLLAVAALESDRAERLGELLDASHASLRDDYEVTIPPIDRLVALLREQPGVTGARMTGGGFGGAVVALARAGAGPEAAARSTARYDAETGERSRVVAPHDGAPVSTGSDPAARR